MLLAGMILLAGLLLAGQEFFVRQYVQTGMRLGMARETSVQTAEQAGTEEGGGSRKAVGDSKAEQGERQPAATGVDQAGKTAYLTFDDGPSELTDQYLDILKRYDAKATFFLIGEQIQGDMVKVVRREIDEGHEIGIHTYTHDSSKIYVSADSYYQDVCQVRRLLKKEFQYEPSLWRFPWGSANCYICHFKKDVIERLGKENMDYADWNVSAEDSVGSHSVESILANVRKDCFRVENPVILMHDSNTNRMTLYALDSILSMLSQEGYSFATLDQREKSCHFGEY